MRAPTILGLDPGTRYLGAAVLRGQDLLSYAVHELRNGEEPHDFLGQARRFIWHAIAEHNPDVVAIEAPYRIATPRGAALIMLAKELHRRSQELGIIVRELSPETVRAAVAGQGRANKTAVAQALVRRGFRDLADKLPTAPARSALGLRPKDRYWLHVFDALALAVAVQQEGRIHSAPSEPDAPSTYAAAAKRSTLSSSPP